MSDSTQASRAVNEPKRTAADSSWDVWSNYYFCPSLCDECKYFLMENSNWPFHCKATSSIAASHISKKERYSQYEDCDCFKQK